MRVRMGNWRSQDLGPRPCQTFQDILDLGREYRWPLQSPTRADGATISPLRETGGAAAGTVKDPAAFRYPDHRRAGSGPQTSRPIQRAETLIAAAGCISLGVGRHCGPQWRPAKMQQQCGLVQIPKDASHVI